MRADRRRPAPVPHQRELCLDRASGTG
jgi:hypothetical protein